MPKQRLVVQRSFCIALAFSVAGCATMAEVPPSVFSEKRESMTDEGVCAAAFTAAGQWKAAEGQPRARQEAERYFYRVERELLRRGRTVEWCRVRRNEQEDTASNVVGALAVIGLIGLAVAGAKAGAKSPSSHSPTDTEWAWDEYYNDKFQLVWGCRGRQTAQFAPVERCALALKIDSTWPSKSAPD